ncbi:hypothetical protein [Woodsholea maritima]|uniref:hypothetical protein n=1 Tax=Woodsholea maritima TaxID=240237 RepID=UPI0012EABE44|nr:hypothetical protein [Woodsholea maritima]
MSQNTPLDTTSTSHRAPWGVLAHWHPGWISALGLVLGGVIGMIIVAVSGALVFGLILGFAPWAVLGLVLDLAWARSHALERPAAGTGRVLGQSDDPGARR